VPCRSSPRRHVTSLSPGSFVDGYLLPRTGDPLLCHAWPPPAFPVREPRDPYALVMDLIGQQPALATDLGVGGRLRRLCGAAAGALSAAGVGISVLADDGVHGISAASDVASERLEELQFVLGEGPCIDAVATRRPVLVPDFDAAAMMRWPGYTPAIQDCGARAVFAFPLQVGAARLGAMDVFRTEPGGLSAEELGHALTFAEVAVTILLNGQDAPAGAGAGPAEEVEHRAELFQAQGMVMVQLGVSLAEALTRIRAFAFADNRSLHDVAVDIVERRLRFDRDQP
jgi:ANTAR domain/GAF domain